MTPKTDNHIDTALRSVMERRAERIPALSDDFAQQVMSKMNARKESVTQHCASTPLHYGRGWGWVCSIAAAILVAFLLWPKSNKDTITQPEVQPVVAEASQQTIRPPVIEEKKEEVLAEVQPTKKPVKKRKKTVRKQNTPIEEPVEEIIPAEPVEELTIAMEPTSDSYAAIEAEMIDIRRRGERVEAMVANLTRSF